MSESSPFSTQSGPSNGALIRRLFSLAWRYRLKCVQVSHVGPVGAPDDGYIWPELHGSGYRLHPKEARRPQYPVCHRIPFVPDSYHAATELGDLAGALAALRVPDSLAWRSAGRRLFTSTRSSESSILVQQTLVVDLRAEIYETLQRLSFRFFDANTTGSIITRVTSDAASRCVAACRPGPDPKCDHGDFLDRVLP